MLRVGITGEATNSAQFTHLSRISLHEHVVHLSVQCASEAALNCEVARIQARQHDARWEDTATKAPWRVTVIRDEGRDCADVVFAFHHALMDGTSGRKFHEHLLAALEAATDDGEYTLAFPEPPALPAPQEDAVAFTLGPLYIASLLWSQFAPAMLRPAPQAVWAGGSISFALPYVTRIRPVDIPAGQAKALLSACRQHKTTLTGLLHTLAFAYFTALLPDDIPGFNGATPMGLHKHTRDGVRCSPRAHLLHEPRLLPSLHRRHARRAPLARHLDTYRLGHCAAHPRGPRRAHRQPHAQQRRGHDAARRRLVGLPHAPRRPAAVQFLGVQQPRRACGGAGHICHGEQGAVFRMVPW